MNHQARVSAVIPFSLKDAPAFIEAQMPVRRVSAEVYKERKAIHGQLLTSLGSYWKGRKPLLLVRAVVLGLLLPATQDALADLNVFLTLLRMDDDSLKMRIKSLRPADLDPFWTGYHDLVDTSPKPRWRKDVSKEERIDRLVSWLKELSYEKRISFCLRPEEMQDEISDEAWDLVNRHLGTSARSFDEIVEQLGIMRFGRRPRVADTFAGGGSIPFEAARIGCHVSASDLNPIACMLNWGALNIIGGTEDDARNVETNQRKVVEEVRAEIDALGIERSVDGWQAKSYLYCVEVRCPKTGFLVPLAPSWVISQNHRTVAKLIPRPETRDYEIEIVENATDEEMRDAEHGTLVGDAVVHPANPDREGVSLSVIRGDHRTDDGANANGLRLWSRQDFRPREDDRFRERLYCIQWLLDEGDPALPASLEIESDDEEEVEPDDGRRTSFAAPTAHDIANEKKVNSLVEDKLEGWQRDGLIPSDVIEPGLKTSEPIRTRGWTYWHHLFTPRHLLFGALTLSSIGRINDLKSRGALAIGFCRSLNYMSRMTQWMVRTPTPRKPADVVNHVFYNQALNTFYNFGARSSVGLFPSLGRPLPRRRLTGSGTIVSQAAASVRSHNDLFITDPPYADAVVYHEITEYFIAWMQGLGRSTFPDFEWDSQRALAIKGKDEKFRSEMVAAYRAMAEHMPDNGMQVVMFTHQSVQVWADLAAVLWAAGLRVSAAWNVVTETSSSTKKGNHVKGTILLVLRRRLGAPNAKRMDIEGEIEDAVDHQLRALSDLSQDWTSERLYTDGDLQLAAYAAALRVITSYETIDRAQVGADVYRKLKKTDRTVIRDLIDYAASVANNKLVPEGFPATMWRDLDKVSRFYVRMLDMESKGSTKFSDYQDFAKTFSVNDYADLMSGDTKANQASLAGAGALRGAGLTSEFGKEPLRKVLFATYKVMQKGEPKDGLNFLKLEYGPDYWPMRAKLIEFARYLSAKTARTRPDESAAADLLMQKLEVDRL